MDRGFYVVSRREPIREHNLESERASRSMKNAQDSWKPGTQILQQDLWDEELIAARPVTVVEDKSDCLVLFTHPKTLYRSITSRNRYSVPVTERIDL